MSDSRTLIRGAKRRYELVKKRALEQLEYMAEDLTEEGYYGDASFQSRIISLTNALHDVVRAETRVNAYQAYNKALQKDAGVTA